MNYEELYTMYEDRGKAAMEGTLKTAFLENTRLLDTLKEIASIEPVRNQEGKVSAKETISAIKTKDNDLFHAVLLFAEFPTRSYISNNEDRNRTNALVPLLMSAYKEHADVMYEEWDKQDDTIDYAVGFVLWDAIKEYLQPIEGLDDDLANLRMEAVNRMKNPKQQKAYRCTSLKIKGKTVPKIISMIKAQFWVAHPEYRNEYMILDTINWDDMPDALDETEPSIDNIVSEKTNGSRKSIF